MNHFIVVYTEEDADGVSYATRMTFYQWLIFRKAFIGTKPEGTTLPYRAGYSTTDVKVVNPPMNCIIEIKLLPMQDMIIDDEPISRPLVPLKQPAAYSHKAKSLKRVYKTQKR